MSTDIAAAQPDALVRYATATIPPSDLVLAHAPVVATAIDRARAGMWAPVHRHDFLGEEVADHARAAAALAQETSAVGVAFAVAGGAAGIRALARPLRRIDDGEVAAFVAGVLGLPLPGGIAVAASTLDPDAVALVAAMLTPQQLARLAADHPHLVGPVDGMPFELRFAANRVLIARAADAADLIGATDRSADLRALLEDGRQILFVDPSGDGRAAAAVGDLEAARNIAVVIPGMGNSLANFASATMSKGQAIFDEAEEGTAVIAWLGYDSPGADVLLDDAAIDGAEHLVRLLDGLPDAPLRTVVGHSYGTVVTAAALQRGLDVDQVVVTGSPGMLEASADQLSAVPVWAARAPLDAVSWSEAYGRDPSDPRFGATRFDTGSEIFWHSGYFEPGSESLANIGRIVSGNHDEVTVIEPGLVEDLIDGLDGIHGQGGEVVDGAQGGLRDVAGAIAWSVDNTRPILPGAAEDLVDALQHGTGDVLELVDRTTDFGQRLTSPDLLGDIGLDAWHLVHDHGDDVVREIGGAVVDAIFG